MDRIEALTAHHESADELLNAIATAETDARRLHNDGRCSESEWSCSWCEACPSNADGAGGLSVGSGT